jgi:hypothetical protein
MVGARSFKQPKGIVMTTASAESISLLGSAFLPAIGVVDSTSTSTPFIYIFKII